MEQDNEEPIIPEDFEPLEVSEVEELLKGLVDISDTPTDSTFIGHIDCKKCWGMGGRLIKDIYITCSRCHGYGYLKTRRVNDPRAIGYKESPTSSSRWNDPNVQDENESS